MTVTLTLLATIVIASVVGLSHRGGEFEADRAQVAAFLVMAKAHAATVGDGAGSTGATVVASYTASPFEATTLTLYDGRPFAGASIARTPNVAQMRVGGRLGLTTIASLATSDHFAIFFGTSGATSALDPYDVDRTLVATEPPCDLQTGVPLSFTLGSNSDAMRVSCETGEIVPELAPRKQQRAGLQEATRRGSRESRASRPKPAGPS